MTDHGPIQPAYRQMMANLAVELDRILNGEADPRTVGFCLFVFNLGATENGRVNYISNCDRNEMIVAVKEWLARAEGRVQPPGNA
jgi:hypothetical protein